MTTEKTPTKKQLAEIEQREAAMESAAQRAIDSANIALDEILRTTQTEGQSPPKTQIRGSGEMQRYTNMLHLFGLLFAHAADELGWEGFETFAATILNDPRSELFGDTYQKTLIDMINGYWQTDAEKSENDRKGAKILLAKINASGMTMDQLMALLPEPKTTD